MRKFMIFIIFFASFLFPGCHKKKEESNKLTPLNAPEKYGETMGKAMKRSKVLTEVLPLKQTIDAFYIQEGRYPKSLQELVDRGYIKELPKLPEGKKFVYDSKTGIVDIK